jgi:hypothetical protein
MIFGLVAFIILSRKLNDMEKDKAAKEAHV